MALSEGCQELVFEIVGCSSHVGGSTYMNKLILKHVEESTITCSRVRFVLNYPEGV